MVMKSKSKIPDLTDEILIRIQRNTENLIKLGYKNWMKSRKVKRSDIMDEAEQKETLRKLEEGADG